MEEVRITDPDTGGQKGAKEADYSLIPAGPLWELAVLYGRGSKKYARHNWTKGYAWSLSFAALMRHAWLFWRGEDVDKETGVNHMICVAFHAFALVQFCTSHPEKDDRVKEEVKVWDAGYERKEDVGLDKNKTKEVFQHQVTADPMFDPSAENIRHYPWTGNGEPE